ncbi:uncharacterized protein LOC110044658 [Orbicella faveolata]|uniref:uncharacterized protein LOC110044658 n=1 Tax=Orbicella faveolata TaxID=48498 RepID=UPI0009E420FC|nr:uncharacterized protein LOC110044658 [Orbicella faveolata]
MGSKSSLLFFLLFTYNSIGKQDFCSDSTESFGTPFQNRALVGYIIKSLVTRGILSCNHKCLSLSSCSSYNYQASATQGGVCELNGGKRNIHQNLVKRHGFVFVLVRRKVKITQAGICREVLQLGTNQATQWFPTGNIMDYVLDALKSF